MPFSFMENLDEKLMALALKEANKCPKDDEVPVGCIIVNSEGKIIAKGHNKREKKHSVFSHAEVEATSKASKELKDWQLVNCTIYITLEPCIMCAGAILQSRFSKIVYGAKNPKAGAFGSSINVVDAKNLNVNPEIVSGVLEEECSAIIKDYFKNKRK